MLSLVGKGGNERAAGCSQVEMTGLTGVNLTGNAKVRTCFVDVS